MLKKDLIISLISLLFGLTLLMMGGNNKENSGRSLIAKMESYLDR